MNNRKGCQPYKREETKEKTVAQKRAARFHAFCYGGKLCTEEELKEFLAELSNECYLTGDKINLEDSSSYQLDHKTPNKKGGSNSLENCGVCTPQANLCKSNLTEEEFVKLCRKVLEHRGYSISNP